MIQTEHKNISEKLECLDKWSSRGIVANGGTLDTLRRIILVPARRQSRNRYSPDVSVTNFGLGILGAAMCAIGWGVEAVIAAKCMQDVAVIDEYAIQIRESTSAIVYAVILLQILHGWPFTVSLFNPSNGMLIPLIAIAGALGCVSYMFYYKAITQIGASKSMALNITYAAWSIVFTVLILHDTSVLTPVTIGCAIIVIVCGMLAAADFKDLFGKSKGQF